MRLPIHERVGSLLVRFNRNFEEFHFQLLGIGCWYLMVYHVIQVQNMTITILTMLGVAVVFIKNDCA
jgi:hypothetical protein